RHLPRGDKSVLIVRAVLAMALLAFPIGALSQEATPQAKGVKSNQQTNSLGKGQQNDNPKAEPTGENVTVVVPTTIDPTQPAVSEKAIRQQTDSGEEKAKEFWIIAGYAVKITDFFIALFNGLLVIVTILLWRSTDKLWSESTKATEIARDAANVAAESANA